MTKKERNDSEQEQATMAEALAILEAIRKSLVWTYPQPEKGLPAGHIIPSDSGLVGRLTKFVDKLIPMPASEMEKVPFDAGDIGEGRWLDAHKKLNSGEIIEITQKFFDYFLGVLPPVGMGRWVRLQNGREIRSAFEFAEGAERITAYWIEDSRFYAAQTNQVNY